MRELIQTRFIFLSKTEWEELVLLKKLLGNMAVSMQLSDIILEIVVEAIPIYRLTSENENQMVDISVLLSYLFNVEEIIL